MAGRWRVWRGVEVGDWQRPEKGEAVEIGAEDIALDEVGEFALALDADEAGVCKFFHVVGEVAALMGCDSAMQVQGVAHSRRPISARIS